MLFNILHTIYPYVLALGVFMLIVGVAIDVQKSKHSEKEKNTYRLIIANGAILIIAGLILFVRVMGIVNLSYVPSGSMENTIRSKSIIMTVKQDVYHRGDVVVFYDDLGWMNLSEQKDKHLVKRIIGLPGDKVVACNANNKIEVNGQELNEPYIKEPKGKCAGSEFSVTVPKGKVLVLGDNRLNSADSSIHELNRFVDMKNIEGKVIGGWDTKNKSLFRTPNLLPTAQQ